MEVWYAVAFKKSFFESKEDALKHLEECKQIWGRNNWGESPELFKVVKEEEPS